MNGNLNYRGMRTMCSRDLWITTFGKASVKARKFPLILYVFYFDVFPVCERLEVGPDTGPHHRVHPHCGLVQDENLGTVEHTVHVYILYTLYTLFILYTLYSHLELLTE